MKFKDIKKHMWIGGLGIITDKSYDCEYFEGPSVTFINQELDCDEMTCAGNLENDDYIEVHPIGSPEHTQEIRRVVKKYDSKISYYQSLQDSLLYPEPWEDDDK